MSTDPSVSRAESTEQLLQLLMDAAPDEREEVAARCLRKAYSLGYDAAQYDAMGGAFG